MKYILSILIICFSLSSSAHTKYVALKSGVNVYSARDTNSKILTVLAYGKEVIDTLSQVDTVTINNFTTYWLPVQTKHGPGYITEAYTLPFPPPGDSVESFEEYALQISDTINSREIIIDDTANYNQIREKIVHYINGFSTHSKILNDGPVQIYSISMPYLTVQKAYILANCFWYSLPCYTQPHVFPVKILDKDDCEMSLLYTEEEELYQMEFTSYNEGAFTLNITDDGKYVTITLYFSC